LLALPAQGRARHSPVAVRLPLLVSPSEGSSGHCHVCCGAPAATRAAGPPPLLVSMAKGRARHSPLQLT
jgi:hypothetical protein